MNREIIEQFNKLIDQVHAEYINAQSNNDQKEMIKQKYRLQSLKKALSALKKVDFKITSSKDVTDIPGVGKGTLERIDEILKTGNLSEIKSSKTKDKNANIIVGIQELSKVFGIGDKKAHTLVTKHNIKNIAELKNAYNKKKIELDNNILLGLKYYDIVDTVIPRKEITVTEKYLAKIAHDVDPELEIMICGSYRRGRITSGDIDVLMYHPKLQSLQQVRDPEKYKIENYIKLFIDKLSEDGFLLDHITDKKYSMKYMGFSKYKTFPVRRIDIRLVPYKSLYYSMLYFTGPRDLNITMRKQAIKRHMVLNEYGLYKEDDVGALTLIKVNSEEEIFDKLGMDYLTPVERDQYTIEKRKGK